MKMMACFFSLIRNFIKRVACMKSKNCFSTKCMLTLTKIDYEVNTKIAKA